MFQVTLAMVLVHVYNLSALLLVIHFVMVVHVILSKVRVVFVRILNLFKSVHLVIQLILLLVLSKEAK